MVKPVGGCDVAVWYGFARNKAVAWWTVEPQTGGYVVGSPVGGALRLGLCTWGHCELASWLTGAERGCHQTGYQVLHQCSQAFQACGHAGFHSVLWGNGGHISLEARVLTLLLGLYFQKLGLWYYS